MKTLEAIAYGLMYLVIFVWMAVIVWGFGAALIAGAGKICADFCP